MIGQKDKVYTDAKTMNPIEICVNELAKLEKALSEGKSETLVQYLNAMARFHQYSYANVLLIFSQRPDATHVAGYKKWKELGRWVRKGEKGIAILAPMFGKKDDKAAEQEGTTREDVGSKLVGFRAVRVFDVSQTDGKALPALSEERGDPGEYLGAIKNAIRERKIELVYSDDLGASLGSSSGGTIKVANGLTAAVEFGTLVHEFAHELLHWNGEKVSQTVRETEAEAVAYVVNCAIGLEVGTASQDYIQLYNGNVSTLRDSLDRIQRTSQNIMRWLVKDESKIKKAA